MDDEARVTMRSGRKLSALQAENNFREPQEAERSEAIDAGASDKIPSSGPEKSTSSEVLFSMMFALTGR